mmetsp:Transcript_26248/g.98805  ORF Transcript_26248/g.98805 Transcript_26248/m.98805 type:complete len:313 (-) Transcript_26248:13-951(-)
MARSASAAASAPTRSTLFSQMRSANATCRPASTAAPEPASQAEDSSESAGSVRRPAAAATSPGRWRRMFLASATVTTPRSSKARLGEAEESSAPPAVKKSSTSGAGSARPDVSITTWSTGGSPASRVAKAMSRTRSSTLSSSPPVPPLPAEQHTQPFASTNTSLAKPSVAPRSRSWSSPTDPTSFSITQIRESLQRSKALSSVVFPAPRKPVTIVTGMRSESPHAAAAALSLERLSRMRPMRSCCRSTLTRCAASSVADPMTSHTNNVGPLPLGESPRPSASQMPSIAARTIILRRRFGRGRACPAKSDAQE